MSHTASAVRVLFVVLSATLSLSGCGRSSLSDRRAEPAGEPSQPDYVEACIEAHEDGSYATDPCRADDCDGRDYVRRGCEEAGASCPEPWITREAAICIAREEGLDEGIRGYQAQITYNVNHEVVVWGVRSVTREENLGTVESETWGEGLLLNAQTGEKLSEYEWGAQALVSGF